MHTSLLTLLHSATQAGLSGGGGGGGEGGGSEGDGGGGDGGAGTQLGV